MCSITDQARGRSRGPRLATLIGHGRDIATAITADLLDPDASADLAGLPLDALSAQLRDLLTTIDQTRAATAVVTGVVNQAVAGRQLIEGVYASTTRFLQVEAGLSEQSAKALTARAHDLADAAHDGDPRVRDAWLAGDLTDDKVRVLTAGVREAVKREPVAQRRESTRAALDLLLPHAAAWTVADLRRAVGRIRFVVDPDGVRQAELDAYTEQSLTCVPVGQFVRLQAWLDAETAAAVMTVLDQQVSAWRRDGDLAAEDHLPDGVDPDSAEGRRLARQRDAHQRALALGEVMTGLLGRDEVGMHHGTRPHLVLTVDARDLAAGLGGELSMPGRDEPVLVSSDTVRRILCDTGLTHVITQPVGCDQPTHAEIPGRPARPAPQPRRRGALRRTRGTHRTATTTTSAGGAGPALPGTGLPTIPAALQRPPRPALGTRRRHHDRELPAALRTTPPGTARRPAHDHPRSGQETDRDRLLPRPPTRPTTHAVTSTTDVTAGPRQLTPLRQRRRTATPYASARPREGGTIGARRVG